MPIINLRSQYPHLSEDIFMEISDPIFEVYDHSRRIYAYFMLNMKMVGIARIEGVSRTSVSQSIRSGLKNLKRYFKQTEME